MIADGDGLPRLDESARTLGARPAIDVPSADTEEVDIQQGGMSATSGSPANLPIHRRPPSIGGTGRDPIFAIEVEALGVNLLWRRDPDGPSGHGFLEPVRRMPFAEYQQALWATRPHWKLVEP